MTTRSTKWPLTGGISSQLSSAEDNRIKRIYIGGYQDGSVRIWDATFPVLSLIFVLGSNVSAMLPSLLLSISLSKIVNIILLINNSTFCLNGRVLLTYQTQCMGRWKVLKLLVLVRLYQH